MTEGYEPGREARRSILREVYRREKAGEHWPTTRQLGKLLDLHHATIARHIEVLIGQGLLERQGYRLGLTDCARSVLDLEAGG